jgi:putative glutamine amidotransferase
MIKKTVSKPLVLIPADVKHIGEHPFHAVGQKYILAVAEGAQATPLIIPAISDYLDINTLLLLADGILLTGSPSNLHPSHFGQAVHNPDLPLDPARDALTLSLVRAAIDVGVPLLAICRGFQELNVAFGGSLHQTVHEVSGLIDHREVAGKSIKEQYEAAHPVSLLIRGKLEAIVGSNQMMVNSIHGQGIDRLGLGLTAEAHAPDGLIEAISVDKSKSFAMGVQWHPEWQVMKNPDYLAIFKAFGDACRARMCSNKPPD